MDIKIVSAADKYIDDCIRVGIQAWKSVHKSYAACIGEDLHQELMGDWQEKKAEIMAQCPDISHTTIQRALNDLVKSGEIIKIGGGRYTSYTWNGEID